jgi:hypothetical protein
MITPTSAFRYRAKILSFAVKCLIFNDLLRLSTYNSKGTYRGLVETDRKPSLLQDERGWL